MVAIMSRNFFFVIHTSTSNFSFKCQLVHQPPPFPHFPLQLEQTLKDGQRLPDTPSTWTNLEGDPNLYRVDRTLELFIRIYKACLGHFVRQCHAGLNQVGHKQQANCSRPPARLLPTAANIPYCEIFLGLAIASPRWPLAQRPVPDAAQLDTQKPREAQAESSSLGLPSKGGQRLTHEKERERHPRTHKATNNTHPRNSGGLVARRICNDLFW